jgi:NADH dehydrogenase
MSTHANPTTMRRRVIVVGGGFAGLHAVRELRPAHVDITLIDRRNFHLFEPLVYQVATGALTPGVLGEVTGFDLERQRVGVEVSAAGNGPQTIPYDSLIVAAGSRESYFGHDPWRRLAPDIKAVEGALEVRRRIPTAFQAAEEESDPGPS